jgi:cytochrome c peroxidase|tara:strand:+ start:4073 stop:5401 length:1329 start_codon:yes stop_codon:yes gene_type:complete
MSGFQKVAGVLAGIAAYVLTTTSSSAGPLPSAYFNFPEFDASRIELGQLLFFDPILSGNKTVSCATCHHPKFNTADGLSLGIGDGGIGLGTDRKVDAANPPEKRIPRNAPALFNLGASEFVSFFHDGRLEVDKTRASGIRTPLGGEMESGFASLLSAQTMFPVLSAAEMAGHFSENDVSKAVRQGVLTGDGGAWDILAKRVEAIPEYRAQFDPIIGSDKPIHFTDISDAIAAFVDFEWRATNSPFDLHLRLGQQLEAQAEAGKQLFYGDAGCATCHSGLFQTDHQFHAIAMPQIGPGKAAGFERHQRDEGRMRVTGNLADAYAFRTPSLRNVAHTSPYGHSGAYGTLEEVVRHHLDPVGSLNAYLEASAVLPVVVGKDDFAVMRNTEEVAKIAAANALASVDLDEQEIGEIIAFLNALTDPQSLKGALGIPASVPSGLPLDQ